MSLGSYDSRFGDAFHSSGVKVSTLAKGWHRLTLVAEQSEARIYIDGTYTGSSWHVSETDIISIGGWPGQPWGYLSRLRIYTEAVIPS